VRSSSFLLADAVPPAHDLPHSRAGGCGSFYAISVEHSSFKGLSMIKQHRVVNDLLKDEIKGMHGLQVRAPVLLSLRPTPSREHPDPLHAPRSSRPRPPRPHDLAPPPPPRLVLLRRTPSRAPIVVPPPLCNTPCASSILDRWRPRPMSEQDGLCAASSSELEEDGPLSRLRRGSAGPASARGGAAASCGLRECRGETERGPGRREKARRARGRRATGVKSEPCRRFFAGRLCVAMCAFESKLDTSREWRRSRKRVERWSSLVTL